MLVHQETRGLVASALVIAGGGPAYAASASSRSTMPTVTSGRFWYSVRPGARPPAAGITAATFTGRGAYPRAWAYVAAGQRSFDAWFARRFTGQLRPAMVAVFFLPYVAALLRPAMAADRGRRAAALDGARCRMGR
jgi:hypothetical protein